MGQGTLKLSAGTRLGSYEVADHLASGGMGEVYRARHLHLDRWVAIKVLPEDVSADAKALRRFRREARAASNLSHPNICTVFDFGHDDEIPYLVLELLEGQTLAERLDTRTRLTIPEALGIGAEIAGALAHAHQHGLVHRDLKPGNIMLTSSGAKVLDFGLVKRRGGSEARGREGMTTASYPLTREGAVVGTAPYMAPEQAEGLRTDTRTDIHALGVVLYEMLTGRRPFAAATPAALSAAILESEPVPISELLPDVPPALVRTVNRCLAKEPDARWQSAHDLAAELVWIGSTSGVSATSLQRAAPAKRRRVVAWSIVGAAVLLAVIVAQLWTTGRGHPETQQVFAFEFAPPQGVAFAGGVDSTAAISPDGGSVAFVGSNVEGRSLWTQSLDGRAARRLPGTQLAGQPFWAPDGRSVGFFAGQRLQVVRLAGGPPRPLAPVSTEYRGGSWGAEGTILFSAGPQTGLSRVSPDGGEASPLTRPDRSRGEIGHLWPHFLPDGEHFLYFVTSENDAVRGVYVASLTNASGRRILSSAASAAYANGHILHMIETNLMARPFDLRRLEFEGASIPIADGVASFFTYQGVFSSSSTGVLVYSKAESTIPTQLRWADASGTTTETIGSPGERRKNPSLSRDGRYLAVETHEGTDSDISIVEVGTGRRRRMRDPRTQAMFPVLSPAGGSLIFAVERSGGSDIYRLETDRADPPRVILRSEVSIFPTDWSADGELILLAERTSRGDYDTLVLRLDGDEGLRRLLGGPYHEGNARFSPSGKYFAYVSNETGVFEVYVERYPPSGLKCQVSGGGYDPHWGRGDDQIFYLSPEGDLMSVEVEIGDSCALAKPDRMFDARVKPPATSRNHFEIDPERGRYLLNSTVESPGFEEVAVVVNWPSIAARSAA